MATTPNNIKLLGSGTGVGEADLTNQTAVTEFVAKLVELLKYLLCCVSIPNRWCGAEATPSSQYPSTYWDVPLVPNNADSAAK